MTHREMLDYITKQIPLTTDRIKLVDLDTLSKFMLNELVNISPRSHTAAFAYDPGLIKIFDERCRNMFFSVLGIDSRNYEESIETEKP